MLKQANELQDNIWQFYKQAINDNNNQQIQNSDNNMLKDMLVFFGKADDIFKTIKTIEKEVNEIYSRG